MKARLFPACAFFAAAIAASAFAQTDSTPPPAAPAVLAQFEIRGLAPLVGQAARIAAPFLPPEQLEGLVKGFLSTACPVDLLSLVGDTSADPVRVALYAKPDGKECGAFFDFPAAGGDTAAFFDVIARTCASSSVPAAVAAHLPLDARIYRLPDPSGLDDPRILFLPHDGRVAAFPLGFRGGVSTVQAAGLLPALSEIAADGVLAVRFDAEAFAGLAAQNPAALPAAADSFRNLAATSVSFGIGLDDADRLRFDQTCALRPGSAYAAYFSTVGAPAPFVNAVLFPDALAASVERADRSHAAAIAEEIFSAALSGGDDPATRAVLDFCREFSALLPSLSSLSGTDTASALYPPAPGKPFPWALCTTRPEGVETPADFATRVNADAETVLALAARAVESFPDRDALPALPAFALEPRGERTVADAAVQTFALRMIPADGSEAEPRDLLSFDVALAGPALVLADLPDDRLSDVLSALAPDAPARPGIDALPAFAAAYGPVPPDASAFCVKLAPLIRSVLGFADARLPELKEMLDLQAPPEVRALSGVLGSFLEALSGVDLPLAVAVRSGDAPDTVRETVSFPLADLHSIVSALVPLASGADSGDTPDDVW